MAHLPNLLDATQYQDRAGRSDDPLDPAELAQFNAFAADMSALVRQVAGQDFLDGMGELDVPHGVLPVAFRVVDRAMENRRGLASETQGNYTWRKETGGSSGVYLTPDDETDIQDAIGKPRFKAITMVSPYGTGLPATS